MAEFIITIIGRTKGGGNGNGLGVYLDAFTPFVIAFF